MLSRKFGAAVVLIGLLAAVDGTAGAAGSGYGCNCCRPCDPADEAWEILRRQEEARRELPDWELRPGREQRDEEEYIRPYVQREAPAPHPQYPGSKEKEYHERYSGLVLQERHSGLRYHDNEPGFVIPGR